MSTANNFARVDGVIGGAGKKYFYHNDHLGSALVVTDEDGNIVVERDFTSFGERINVDLYDETNRDPAEDDSGFTGKDWDADIGLYYFNARWYDPEIGRFISQDSAEDDPTLYVYGFNNPMKFVDPSGLIAESLLDYVDIKGGMLNIAAQTIPGLGMVLQGTSLFKNLICNNSIVGLSSEEIENKLMETYGEASVDIVKMAYVADAVWFLATGDKKQFADNFSRAFNLSLPGGYKEGDNSKQYNTGKWIRFYLGKDGVKNY